MAVGTATKTISQSLSLVTFRYLKVDFIAKILMAFLGTRRLALWRFCFSKKPLISKSVDNHVGSEGREARCRAAVDHSGGAAELAGFYHGTQWLSYRSDQGSSHFILYVLFPTDIVLFINTQEERMKRKQARTSPPQHTHASALCYWLSPRGRRVERGKWEGRRIGAQRWRRCGNRRAQKQRGSARETDASQPVKCCGFQLGWFRECRGRASERADEMEGGGRQVSKRLACHHHQRSWWQVLTASNAAVLALPATERWQVRRLVVVGREGSEDARRAAEPPEGAIRQLGPRRAGHRDQSRCDCHLGRTYVGVCACDTCLALGYHFAFGYFVCSAHVDYIGSVFLGIFTSVDHICVCVLCYSW